MIAECPELGNHFKDIATPMPDPNRLKQAYANQHMM